ncbi:RHS repeat-associated core domain-containing protein [Cellulomonas soli]
MTSAATGNAPPRYGWLGAAQRSADTPTGTILMGVRLYSPVIGRFLQVDPVPGGSASAYDYCNADPVNCTDLGGTFSWKGLAKVVAVVAETASMFVPGPVGAAVGALAAGAHLAAGDKDAAKMAAIGAAATLVGAGLAVAAVKAARVVKTAQTLGRLATRAAPKMARAAVAAVRDAHDAVKVVRAASRSVGNAPGIGNELVVSERAATWAGRLWTPGAGSRVTSIGGRISGDGLRQVRATTFKAVGYRQANFESRLIPKKRWVNNYHVRIH